MIAPLIATAFLTFAPPNPPSPAPAAKADRGPGELRPSFEDTIRSTVEVRRRRRAEKVARQQAVWRRYQLYLEEQRRGEELSRKAHAGKPGYTDRGRKLGNDEAP